MEKQERLVRAVGVWGLAALPGRVLRGRGWTGRKRWSSNFEVRM